MAIYNSPNDYYDPFENAEPRNPGVMSVLANTAKTFAIFGVANIIGVGATRFLSRKTATFIAKNTTGRAAEIAKSLKEPTLGGILKNTGPGKQLNELFRENTSGIRQALEARRSIVAEATRQNRFKGDMVRVTSAFKDLKTFTGTFASLWSKSVWAGAGVAYAIDNFAGLTGIQKKPIYDIPGQAANFGKWMLQSTLFGTPIGALGPAIKFARGAALQGIKGALAGPPGRSAAKYLSRVAPGLPLGPKSDLLFTKEVVEQAQNHYEQRWASRAVKTVSFANKTVEAAGQLNATFRQLGEHVKSAWKTENTFVKRVKTGVINPVVSAIRNTKELLLSRGDNTIHWSPATTPGLTEFEFITHLGVKAAAKPTRTKSSLKPIIESFAAARNNQNKVSIISEIFGFQPLQVKHVVSGKRVKEVLGNLSKSYTKEESTQLMRHVLNARVGPHIYKPHGSNIKGGGVDLSFMDPMTAFHRAAANILGIKFNIPLTGATMDLGSVTHLTTALAQPPKFAFFEKDPHIPIQDRQGGVPTPGEIVDKEGTYFFLDGKWGIVNGNMPRMLPGNRNIKWGPSHSIFRKMEMIDATREAKKTSDQSSPPIHSKYLRWANPLIDKYKLKLPGMASFVLDKLNLMMGDKNHTYRLASNMLSDPNPDRWFEQLPVLGALKEHTGQELLPVFKNKEAFSVILGNKSAAELSGDIWDQMSATQPLMKSIDDMGLRVGSHTQKTQSYGLKEAIELMKADPIRGTKHIAVHRMGRLSEMSVADVARVGVVEDALRRGMPFDAKDIHSEHPLIKAIPELRRRGLINERQAQAMELHAHLMMFEDAKLFNYRKANDPEFVNAVKVMRERMSGVSSQLQEKIIDYTQHTKMRTAHSRKLSLIGDTTDATLARNNSPYVSMGKGAAGLKDYTRATMNTVTNLLSDTVFPFKIDPVKDIGIRGNLKYILGGSAKIAAASFAFKALDSFVAANPAFNDTCLNDGIGPFLADQAVKGRLAAGRVFDVLGITGTAKYLNGLMPGFVTSAPGGIIGAVVSRTLGGGPLAMAKWFAGGAIANRLLSPMLPDFTKTYDQLKAEYSGEVEVPIMKNPYWLLGGTPWQGSKVIGYRPNWYVRLSSRWKETDTMYGSTFRKLLHEPIWPLGVSIGDFVDPFYLERHAYFSRPYGLSGGFGEEIPVIGPLVASTVGRIIKPQVTMHREFLQGSIGEDQQTYPFAITPPTLQESLGMMRHTAGLNSMGGRSASFGMYTPTMGKNWAHGAGEDFLDNVTNFAGLPGFLAKTARKRLIDKQQVYPTLETAGRIASQSRSFYDLNLGGLGIFTEGIRRLINKPDADRYGINPIPNLMPDYLPEEFTKGDPFTKVMSGELRLPGSAYSRTHPGLKRSMPARACFTPDTLIDTKDGLVPITQAKTTLTFDGSYQNINKLFEKDFNGQLLEIELKGINKRYNIKTTKNHNIFVIKTNKCKYYPDQSKLRRCCFECNKKIKYCNVPDYEIKEYTASKLEVGDYLISPIIPVENSIKEIDLKLLLKSFNKYYIKQRYNKDEIWSSGKKRLNRYLPITTDLMKLIGFYLAEGSIRDYQVNFSFNKKEDEFYNFVIKVSKKIFNASYNLTYHDNAAQLVINSTILRDILLSLCGKTKLKKLPYFIYNIGIENITSLLSGYFLGDGCYIKGINKKQGRELSSVSCIENLSFSIFKLLCSLGFRPGISYKTAKDVLFIKEKRIISSSNCFRIRLYGEQAEILGKVFGFIDSDINFKSLIYKGFIPFKIVDIKEKYYCGKVYDLNIEKNHNYCVPFALVHNSMIGSPTEHSIQYFTGLLPPVLKEEYDIMEQGTGMHKAIQNLLASEGMLIQAEALVYDVKHDISGHVDAIIKDGTGGKGRRAIEIKTIGSEAFDKLDAPKNQHMCLTGTNNVIMNNGSIKSIKDIEPGQFIRNRFGKKEQVISTSKREINETIYKLTMFGQSNNSIECTHNHQLLGIKTKRCSYANSSNSSSPCFEGRGPCYNCKHKYYLDYKPEWIEAKDLNNGDFLLRYKPKCGVLKYFNNKFNIKNYLTNRSRKIPNFTTFDYDIGKLFGYYLAEGSATKRQIIWSFHIKEKEYTDDISNILKSIGLDSTLDEQIENNVRNIICNSTVFSAIIQDLFSKTKTKKIDRRLFYYNINFLKGIFDGYMRGDGHITKDNKYILGTASYQLVIDLMDLCIILGYNPALTIKRQKKCSIKGIWVKTQNLFYRLDFYKDKTSGRFIRDFGEYIGYRVRKIDKYIYNGYVYDIEVEKSRSFCLTNIISSNSQLNFYLRMLKMREGTLLYVNRDNPSQVKTYNIHYSKHRFEKDLDKLQQARQTAADMLGEGVADKYGYSYSWLDRLNILSDISPSSKEFKEAKYMVQQQIKFGVLDEKEISKYKRTLKHHDARMRTYELYPKRFGDIMSPDSTVNIQSINEDIKAAADYPLPIRALSALWEKFVNTHSIITDKLFAFKDPLEHYKQIRLYGREFTPWDEPYRSFIDPYRKKMLSKTDPFGGALAWGSGGLILGGGFGASLMGALGALYGSANGLLRKFNDAPYIPGEVKQQRQISDYFDAAKYERYNRLATLSDGLVKEEFLNSRDATIKAFTQNPENIANLFRGTSYMEKPYLSGWLNVIDKNERSEILKYIPKNLGNALKVQWGKNDAKNNTEVYNGNVSNNLVSGPKYKFDKSIFDPSVFLEDIEMKTVQDQGMKEHDFGLGWNEQLLRLQEGVNPRPVDTEEYMSNTNEANPLQVKSSLSNIFIGSDISPNIQVYINNSFDTNIVNVTVRRDRSRSIARALRNSEQYG